MPLDVKVFIMNMCFCLIRITKIPEYEVENILKSLCEDVKVGINNIIQAHNPLARKKDVLGHEISVEKELEVSYILVYKHIVHVFESVHSMYIPVCSCCRCGMPCFLRICLWLQQHVVPHGLRSAARQ